MSSPQVEDGYTRIANELLDAILRYPFTKRQLVVLLAIVRKTYGYNKKTDDISTRQLERMTGIDHAHVVRALNELVQAGVVVKEKGDFGQILTLNKDYESWAGWSPAPEEHTEGGAEMAPEVVPKQHQRWCQNGTNKRQLQKTTPKDIERGEITEGGAKTAPPRKPTPTPKKRGTQINGFQMGEEIRTWARENGIQVDLDQEFEKFRDYHLAKGSVFKDWNAALRNWLRKAQEYQNSSRRRRHETDPGVCPGSAQEQIKQVTREFLRLKGHRLNEPGGIELDGEFRIVG